MDPISSFVLAGVATLMVIAFVWYIICIVGAIADFFDKDARKEKKMLKEFSKKFKDPKYGKLSRLRDSWYIKNHNKPNFENLSTFAFAVRYVDPETLDYNDTYHSEWG